MLSNSTQTTKADNYDYLHSWLGTGLFTASEQKWKARRKLLTPAFHFCILEDFIPILNEQAKILANKLSKTSTVDDIEPYITACTLDIICETAMGTTIKAEEMSKSRYIEAVAFLSECFMQRQVWPHMWTPIFRITPYGKRHQEALNVVHGFTKSVIRKKMEEKALGENDSKDRSQKSAFMGKRKIPQIDTLKETFL